MTLKEVYPLWYNAKIDQVKEPTLIAYQWRYHTYLEHHKLADTEITEIRQSEIQGFLSELIASGLMKSSCKSAVGILKEIIRYYYISNRMVCIPLDVKYPRYGLKDSNEQRIHSAMDRAVLTNHILKNKITGQSIGVLLATYLGLRVGEVCGLKWDDIDFTRNRVHIHRTVERLSSGAGDSLLYIGPAKTKSSNRLLPMSEEIRAILQAHRGASDTYIVSGKNEPTEPSSMRRSFKRICNKAGITYLRFHNLRHGFATHLVSSKIDYVTISNLMGHSKAETTMNYYAHSDDGRRMIAVTTASHGMLSFGN